MSLLNLTVLAGSYVEGRRFLADHGLRGNVVHSGDSALGRRFDVVLELPSYVNCRARFGIEARLRAQGERSPVVRMLVDPTELAEPEAPAVAGPDELAGQVSLEEALAEVPETPEVPPAAEPASTPKPRYQPHSKSAAAKAARRKSA